MSRGKAKLRAVPEQPTVEPEPPKDIYAADRERIAAIDWGALHIRSDKSAPVDLPPSRLRKALGYGLRTERKERV